MKQLFYTMLVIVPFCSMITAYHPSVNGYHPANVADPTLNGEWFLQPVLPSDTAAGKLPWLKFNVAKNSFTGNDGCNDIIGTISHTDTTMKFISMSAITKETCPGFNEKEFLNNLKLVNSYRINEGVLELMFNRTVLSRWHRDKKTRKSNKI